MKKVMATNVENGVSIEVSAKFGAWIISNPEFTRVSREDVAVTNDNGIQVDVADIFEGTYGDDSLIVVKHETSPTSAIIHCSKSQALDICLERIWHLEQQG